MHFLEFLLLLNIQVTSALLANAISRSLQLDLVHGVPPGSEVLVARNVAEVKAGGVSGEEEEGRADQAGVAHDARVSHVQSALPYIIDRQEVTFRYLHKEQAGQAESDECVKGRQP